jgi:hypothetical protein
MSNRYDAMAGQLADGKTAGMTAIGSSIVASIVFPEYLLTPIQPSKSGLMLKILGRVPLQKIPTPSVLNLPVDSVTVGATNVPMRLALILTDTGAMCRACARLQDSADAGYCYAQDLEDQHRSVSEKTWQANDQKAFSGSFDSYYKSVRGTALLAEFSAMMTSVIAVLRYVQLAVSMVLSLILAIVAAIYLATFWFPPTAAFAQQLRTSFLPVARALRVIIRFLDEIMVQVGMTHAGIMASGTLLAAQYDDITLGDLRGTDILGDAGVEVMGDLLKKLTKGHVDILSD